MNFVLGVAFLWIGSAMIFLATHAPDDVSTPWGMFGFLTGKIRGQAGL